MHYPKTELLLAGWGLGGDKLAPFQTKKNHDKKTHSGSKEGWPSYVGVVSVPSFFKICDPEPVYSMRYNGRS